MCVKGNYFSDTSMLTLYLRKLLTYYYLSQKMDIYIKNIIFMFSLICECQFLSIDKHATIHINIEVRYRIRDQWEEDNLLKKGEQKAQLQRDREDWNGRIKCGRDRKKVYRREYEEEQLTFISIFGVMQILTVVETS